MRLALRRFSLTWPFTRLIQAHVSRRARDIPPPLTIDRRHIYMMPTGGGWFLGAILAVLLLGATHYSDSLVFALTFWIGSIAVVSLYRANKNVLHLILESVDADPVFADQSLRWVLTFKNPSKRERQGLWIGWARDDERQVWHHIDSQDAQRITLDQADIQRGRRQCPAIHIESRWPMGLFRTWTELHPVSEALVYPARRGTDELTTAGVSDTNGQHHAERGHGEFIGHRRYVPGDSSRQIDWKVSARRDELLVREHAEIRAPRIVFDFDSLHTLPREERLSQLARWVDVAAAAGMEYRLRLPGVDFGPAHGSAHRQACLKELALIE